MQNNRSVRTSISYEEGRPRDSTFNVHVGENGGHGKGRGKMEPRRVVVPRLKTRWSQANTSVQAVGYVLPVKLAFELAFKLAFKLAFQRAFKLMRNLVKLAFDLVIKLLQH